MARVALIHTNRTDILAQYRLHSPIHFAGMQQALRGKGHQVTTIDTYGEVLDVPATVRTVLASNPDIVGINGYMSPNDVILDFDDQVITQIRDQRQDVRILVGGQFLATDVYREKVLQTLSPDMAVLGAGELPMAALAESDFSLAGMAENPSIHLSDFEGIPLLSGLGKVNLDDIEISRPNKWLQYSYTDLDWQRGCFGSCKFCAGFRMASNYKSPKRAAEEFRYLLNLGKRLFFTIGPDFTARPEKANALVEELNRMEQRDVKIFSEVRLDSFSQALEEAEALWGYFGSNNELALMVGYETGIPQRLVELGKARSLEEGMTYLPTLLNILDKKYPFTLVLSWMLNDHNSTSARSLFDLLIMIGMLKKYPNLRMNPLSVTNNLGIYPGSLHDKEGVPVNWYESPRTPEAIRALYREMNKMHGQMNRVGRNPLAIWLTKKIQPKQAANPLWISSFLAKAVKKADIYKLIYFAEFLKKCMTQTEISEAQAMADSFEDSRISRLFRDNI